MQKYLSKIDLDWLPLPVPVLRALNLNQGDVVEIEIVADNTLIITKVVPNA